MSFSAAGSLLFSPISIRGLRLENRIVLPAMVTRLSGEDGFVNRQTDEQTMVHALKIPNPGESIQEVQIGQWLKKEGQWVERDEVVVELETDKANLDLPAPAAGVLTKILKPDGAAASIGETIGWIDDAAKPAAAPPPAETAPGRLPDPQVIMPAAQRLLAEHGLQGRDVGATGPGGRLLKEDVLRHLEAREHATQAAPGAAPPAPVRATDDMAASSPSSPAATGDRHDEVVPMTLIRRRIAERLVHAQQEAALLTTFNEIDMSAVVHLRQQYRERFQEKHRVKLGFMSFFPEAAFEALREQRIVEELNLESYVRNIAAFLMGNEELEKISTTRTSLPVA